MRSHFQKAEAIKKIDIPIPDNNKIKINLNRASHQFICLTFKTNKIMKT